MTQMSNEFLVSLDSNPHSEFSSDLSSWVPKNGKLFNALSAKLSTSLAKYSIAPEFSMDKWRSEVHKVASRCIDPRSTRYGQDQDSSQLVVGRVQSGKTANFTGVMALLADNQYPFFIVIAGTSNPLKEQTVSRLKKDLGPRNFDFLVTSSSLTMARIDECANQITQTLKDYKDPRFWDINLPPKPICIVSLKWHEGHLSVVNALLERLQSDSKSKVLISETPVLVIDDECDTATPDGNVNSDRERTTLNREILNLRSLLPNHTYLGYTATPQAQLLMDLDDFMKPQQVSLLAPGPDYLGAEELFSETSSFAKKIEQWSDEDVLPVSLSEAFGLFLVQNYLFHLQDPTLRANFLKPPLLHSAVDEPISMLVHVDRGVEPTSRAHDALSILRENWITALGRAPSSDGILEGTVRSIFETYLKPAFVEFGFECSPTSELLLTLQRCLVETEIRLIQGRDAAKATDFPPEDEQIAKQAWIFVGAQLLDRGQSLPNLTCTYLGRSSGGGAKAREAGGNVDTLLQRGRFFGHRKQYEKLIRGYFSPSSLESLEAISVLEPIWRKALQRIDEENLDLRALPFFLEMDAESPRLRAVRSNVVPKRNRQSRFSGWVVRSALVSRETLEDNSEIIAWLWNSGHLSQGAFEGANFRVELPVEVASDLLSRWNFHSSDLERGLFARSIFDYVTAKLGSSSIELYLMHRDRSDPQSTSAADLYRKGTPISGGDGFKLDLLSFTDQKIHAATTPTIQVQFLRVQNESKVVLHDALGLAIHLHEPLKGHAVAKS
jgi:hypothetical protein